MDHPMPMSLERPYTSIAEADPMVTNNTQNAEFVVEFNPKINDLNELLIG